MPRNDDVRFISSSIKLPSFSPPDLHHPQPRSFFSSLQLNPSGKFAKLPFNFNFQFNFGINQQPINFITQFVRNQPIFHRNIKNGSFHTVFKKSPLFCSATLALSDSETGPASNGLKSGDDSESLVHYKGDESGAVTQSKSVGSNRAAEEERVLISEVFVRNKDGEELERKDLEGEALNALKASRANSALTVREVQEDVHRIIASGYFMSCIPVAVDTRDGIRLIFQVEPNQEFQGLVCEGANVLPSKFIEDAFRDGYGKVVNIRRLDEVMSSIDGWYMERGLFGMVSGVEILSGGIIKLQVSEAEVNDISIRFLDKTGEPTVGKQDQKLYLGNLPPRKDRYLLHLIFDVLWNISFCCMHLVYSMIQGKRDVDTVLAMGIMDDVSIIPQPAGDARKVDLTMNVVERKSGRGISGGGGISSGITSGPLAGLIGSIAIYHKNLFGRNQKLNLSLERGQIDSIFRINYTDPWIEGDDKRTSRAIMIQNSRTPGTLVHGNQPNNNGLTIGRITGGIEYSRPFRPKWTGTTGLVFQRAGAHDEKGIPIIRDFFGSPLTASGNTHDDMLLAKLETVYTHSGDPSSSMFVFNMDQGIPVSPEWLVFNRVNARARQGVVIGPACFLVCLSGGHVVGKFPPHEAFPIGGTNSVRGYEEGALGSGRSYVLEVEKCHFQCEASILGPRELFGWVCICVCYERCKMGPVKGAVFADYGTDLGSGSTVPGDPAGARNKPGSGYGYGIGVRVDSPLGPLRLEYAFNDQGTGLHLLVILSPPLFFYGVVSVLVQILRVAKSTS
ncbi:Outer envelope protein 80, chloroplastic [Sesamum angolense]|uniref:Outer envelope protein 80, chloroplastic n=1 Tax=Sesamum angolense TaxID=2727404 RepID=A0AAE1X8T5_9LAMI|nr:Outer envelope protein 80, chloroplastic [Sesamum angolense]